MKRRDTVPEFKLIGVDRVHFLGPRSKLECWSAGKVSKSLAGTAKAMRAASLRLATNCRMNIDFLHMYLKAFYDLLSSEKAGLCNIN